MTDESILNKIRALRAKASNAASTEAEVEAAAAAITKLMMKYDVEESDLVDRKDPKAIHHRTPPHQNSTGLVIDRCWQGIQALTETKLYREIVGKNPTYSYVGDAPDVEMAVYLHEMIVLYARRSWFRYRAELSENGQKKSATAREDFYTNFGYRINSRMVELAEERQSARSGSTALVVIKTGMIKEKLEQMGITLRKSRRKSHVTRDVGAAMAGASAAENVNLSRPFAGHGKKEQLT